MRQVSRVIYKGLPNMLVAGAAAITCTRAGDLDREHIDKERTSVFHVEFLAQTEPREQPKMGPGDLEQRGRELRSALQQTYQKLVDSHELRGGLHGTDVTATVLPYIPVGISFSEAESILKNAGFVIGRRPDLNTPPTPSRPKDWYAVIAKLSPFSKGPVFKVDLYVSLLPRSPGDYSNVSQIGATFFVSGP